MKRKIPLYNQIQHDILERIQAGIWKPGDRLPAERVLADQFQVSRITAKNAILGLVSEGYLHRHRGKGTFVTDKKVEPLSETAADAESAAPPAKTIGLIMPWMEFRYQALLLSGVEYELSRRGYHLMFRRIDETDSLEAATVRQFLKVPVDGLIIVASRGEYFHDEMLRLVLEKFPLVFVEKYLRDYKVNGVHCDTEKVGFLMGSYLVNRGMKRLGYIGYPPHYTAGVKERFFGFQSALLGSGVRQPPVQLGLTISPDVLKGRNQVGPHDIPKEIVSFLEAHPELDAIATVDAHIAQFVGRACWKLGRRDLSIVCCDEPSFAPDCVMPSAYVDQSPAEIGIAAAQLIVSAIEEQSETALRRIEPRLVELIR